MVYIDTIRYLNNDNQPIISIDYGCNNKRLAILYQDNNIYCWEIDKIFLWEAHLRSKLSHGIYENFPQQKGILIVQGKMQVYSFQCIKYSTKSFKLSKLLQYKMNIMGITNINQLNSSESKTNPEILVKSSCKKVKITFIQTPKKSDFISEVDNNSEDYLLATGTDTGQINLYYFKEGGSIFINQGNKY